MPIVKCFHDRTTLAIKRQASHSGMSWLHCKRYVVMRFSMMRAVLVAVANNLLVEHESLPGALVKVKSLSLLARQIHALSEAGIKEIYLVLDQEEVQVRQEAKKLAHQLGISLSHVAFKQGHSTLLQAILRLENELRDQPFVLVGVEKLIKATTFRALVANDEQAKVVMATKEVSLTSPSGRPDLVQIRKDGPLAVELGYHLTQFDGLSVDAFFYDKDFFEKANEALKEDSAAGVLNVAQLYRQEGNLWVITVNEQACFDATAYPNFLELEQQFSHNFNRQNEKVDNLSAKFKKSLQPLMSWYLSANISSKVLGTSILILTLLAMLMLGSKHYSGLFFGSVFAFVILILQISGQEAGILKGKNEPIGCQQRAIGESYLNVLLIIGLTTHCAHTLGSSLNPILMGGLAITGVFARLIVFSHFQQSNKENEKYTVEMWLLSHPVLMLTIIGGAILNLPLLALTLMAILLNAVVLRRLFWS